MRAPPLLIPLFLAIAAPASLWATPPLPPVPPCLSPSQTEELRTRALASALLPVLVANGDLSARTAARSGRGATEWRTSWSVGLSWQLHKAWQPVVTQAACPLLLEEEAAQ